jgi:hypothetical protein
MADFLLALLRLEFEFVLKMALYGTGRLLLPIISQGRIKVTPLHQPIGRARVLPTRSSGVIIVGDGWCEFIGFVFWAWVVLLLAHFFAPAS